MKRSFNTICIAIFLLVVGIFFYQTILLGKLPVPTDSLVGLYHPFRDLYAQTNPRGVPYKNFLITDPVRQQIPWRKIAMDQWKQGKLPIWNPYTFSGTSLIANIQAAVFYPFNVLFLIFDFPIAWTILVILQPILAGIFLFFYLRNKDIHPVASLFGAIAWSFSGFTIAWLTWGTIVHVALWLPLCLLSIDKMAESKPHKSTLLWLMLGTLSFVMQVFAGHMQIALYTIVVTVAYGLWRFRTMHPFLIAEICIFLFITSIAWVPLLRFVMVSGRVGEVDSWLKEGWFLPWQHLVQFIVPDFFGNPATLNYWGVWNYGEFIGYIGIVPLLFAIAFNKEDRDRFFWLLVGFVSLFFALPTPLTKLFYQLHIPVISWLQPTRLMVLIDFSLVMLAVFGFDAWIKKKRVSWLPVVGLVGIFVALWIFIMTNRFFVSNETVRMGLTVAKRNMIFPIAILFVSLAVLFVSSLVKKRILFLFCVVIFVNITAFDLLRFGWKFTPFTPREYFFPETKILSFLKQQTKPFRIMSTDKRLLPPNVSAYYGIETIEGYDPLMAGRYEELMAAIARGKPDITPPFGFNRIITVDNPDSILLRLFNVRYVLSLRDIDLPFLKKVFQEGETRVYENALVLPRAFLVSEVRWVTNKQEAMNALFDRAFDPANTAIIEKSTTSPSVFPIEFAKGKTTMISYTESSLVIETETEREGFVVVAQSYSPDWHAKIGSTPLPIFRTNYHFMGLLVPRGRNRIEFSL